MAKRKPIIPNSRDLIAEARQDAIRKADAVRAAQSAMLAALGDAEREINIAAQTTAIAAAKAAGIS